MTMRRPLLLPVVLAACVGATGGLVLMAATGRPAPEEAARGRAPEAARGRPAAHGGPASAAARGAAGDRRDAATRGVVGELEIPIGGTVDGLPESVRLEGLAHVTTNVVRDPDFGQPPAVRLSIDLSHVSGVGLSTGASYLTAAETTLLRPLVASDVIELVFPIFPDRPDGLLAARSATASFTLDFDAGTGRFSGGTRGTVAGAAALPGDDGRAP